MAYQYPLSDADNLFSCQWGRGFMDNPKFQPPLAAIDYTLPGGSLMTAPIRFLPQVDWKSQPITAAMQGRAAGTPALEVSGPGSPGWDLARLWNEGPNDTFQTIFDPRHAAREAQAGIDNRVSYNGAGAPYTPSGYRPEQGGVIASLMALPPSLYQPVTGCGGRNNTPCFQPTAASASGMSGLNGLGDMEVSESGQTGDFVTVLNPERPSILFDQPPIFTPAQDPRRESVWCAFARWVNENPALAVAGLIVLYMARGRGRGNDSSGNGGSK